MTAIPLGLCQCGCGQRTRVSPSTVHRYGYVKGQPRPFVRGHYAGRGENWEARFWSHVRKAPGDACWTWRAGIDRNSGYARIAIHGRGRVGVHRLSWELANGAAAPPDLEVCHKCDNRLCVRPDHLFLGTTLDNARDKVAKGRAPRGAENAAAKLNETQVRDILSRPRQRGLRAALAAEFGVSQGTIKQILARKIWTHVAVDRGAA